MVDVMVLVGLRSAVLGLRFAWFVSPVFVRRVVDKVPASRGQRPAPGCPVCL